MVHETGHKAEETKTGKTKGISDVIKDVGGSRAKVDTTGSTTKRTLSGLKTLPSTTSSRTVGRPGSPTRIQTITTGGVPYTVDSPYDVFATKTRDEAASIQAAMASIPGLYPKNRQPQQFTGIFSTYDFDALGKIMGYADKAGLLSDASSTSWAKALNHFNQNPTAAMDYFRVTPPKSDKPIQTTPSAVASSDLNEIFRTAFGDNATAEENKAYATALNNLEKKQGGRVSSQQQQDLQVVAVQTRAQSKISKVAGAGDDETLKALANGTFGKLIRQIRDTYQSNGVPFTSKQVLAQAKRGLQGPEETANIISSIQQSAADFFPAFAKDILGGKTAKEKFAPYIAMASELWEVPEDQVTIKDLSFVAQDAAKAVDVSAFENFLFNDPKYKKTQGYRNTTMNDTQAFLREAGISQ